MALIPPSALDCVVAIGQTDPKNGFTANATGFLYGRAFIPGAASKTEEASYRIFLVTNRHVFNDMTEVVLRFNQQPGGTSETFDLNLFKADGSQLWHAHPDAGVDIAVIPINANLLKEHKIQFHAFMSDHHVLGLKDAQTAGTSEGDGIFVLGFPLGDAGIDRNHVIVRHGVIARVRDYLAGTSKTILIDSTVFPGNSGGPVLTRPEVSAIGGTKSQPRSMLLGVVSAYVPYRDIAISTQTKRPRVIFEENTGLSHVEPIQFVVDLTDQLEASRKGESGGTANS